MAHGTRIDVVGFASTRVNQENVNLGWLYEVEGFEYVAIHIAVVDINYNHKTIDKHIFLN